MGGDDYTQKNDRRDAPIADIRAKTTLLRGMSDSAPQQTL